jgi:prophage tail gpP-like protein
MSIALVVNNNRYEGWMSGEIMSSIMTLSDSFILSGVNIFKKHEIKVGDECSLELGGEVAITGHIDKIEIDLLNNITISGRDKTADLIDCNVSSNATFINQSIASIIKKLAAPFNVTVSGAAPTVISQFVVNQDEAIVDAISRLVSSNGLIITSDNAGNMVIRKYADFIKTSATLIEGVNLDVEKTGVIFDDSQRFSDIKTIGQNYNDFDLSASAKGTSKRNRPKNYIISGSARASECNASAARIKGFTEGSVCTLHATITTLDYYSAGHIFGVKIPSFGLAGSMIIESSFVSFTGDSANVSFNLVSPEKYGGEPMKLEFLK